MTRVLHVTPHLGGGVGKALACLAEAHAAHGPDVAHEIACLDAPEKLDFVERVRALGVPVAIAPSRAELGRLVERADVVQLEFWNHPSTMAALCAGTLPAMRLVVWCHVNGLHFPRIPPGLLERAERFLFTSACSLAAPEVDALAGEAARRRAVVSSGAGVEDLPVPERSVRARPVRYGYIGSQNLAKLHPDYVDMLARVPLPDLRVRMLGDDTERPRLERQCAGAGRPGLLEFGGYTRDVAGELARLDVLVYLLNPFHYGTAENALIEAMAMGVVPVVMDNGAEALIVEHGRTGLVVSDARGLADALLALERDAALRARLSAAAAGHARSTWTRARLAAAFGEQYALALRGPRTVVDFAAALGTGPAQWFRAFVRDPAVYGASGAVALPAGAARHAHLERTKGSAAHFHDRFPGDPALASWAGALAARR